MFSHFTLHKVLYGPIRETFALSAQMVVRCLAKVSDAYKLDKNAKRFFKEHGSIAYDERILKYRTKKQTQPADILLCGVRPGRTC